MARRHMTGVMDMQAADRQYVAPEFLAEKVRTTVTSREEAHFA